VGRVALLGSVVHRLTMAVASGNPVR